MPVAYLKPHSESLPNLGNDFAITVELYTFIGGFRAVVLTGTIQGLVMIVGTSILLAGVIYATGGVENAMHLMKPLTGLPPLTALTNARLISPL